ncbi:Fur family transcriptional regulator [Pricia sp.]|uniref:Fur family transcriptional regulator n=1 Tax=Pricia sp. TaxID=2268138 RepID=UPI003592F067
MKNEEDVKKLLSRKGLKRTPLRIALLGRFLETDHSLSYTDFDALTGNTADKSTIYRNLNRFEQVGLLHRIEDASGVAKYAYGDNRSQHHHLHFLCDSCHNTYCLNKTEEKSIKVPEGFQPRSVNILINGTCPNC